MKELTEESLLQVNGGDGFWSDLGNFIASHTVNGSWNSIMDAYCRYKYGISYKTYCRLIGTN